MKKLSLLSIAHFLVDLCCAALFFGWLNGGQSWWLCMVVYNGCAFALQLPLGLLADGANRNLLFAAGGCALVGAGFLLAASPLLAAATAGIGNGLFHVGGGLEVLNDSDRAAPLGVFVSPGAVGLYLGTAYAAVFARHVWLAPLLLILLGTALLLFGRRTQALVSRNAPLSLTLPKGGGVALFCLFLVVALRSLLGGAFSTGIPTLPGLVPVLCLAFGKAAGGFCADRLGLKRTALLSLGLSCLLLLLPRGYVTLAALFLFNMTMPLTLFGAARLLNGAKGTAFGLLTCALFLGMVPRFLGLPLDLPGFGWAGLTLLSLGLLLMGLKREAEG